MPGDPPIQSLYVTDKPDEAVLLYEGAGTVTDLLGNAASGELSVSLEWAPTPRVSFRLRCKGDPLAFATTSVVVATEEPRKLEAFVRGHTVSRSNPGEAQSVIRGDCRGEYRSTEERLTHVIFSVANLPSLRGTSLVEEGDQWWREWHGRNIYEGSHWKLTLDELYRSESDTSKWLRGAGYGITHVGKLQRRDGATTSIEDASSALDAVSQFLGFVRGEPAPVLLPRGIGTTGEVVWEKWSSPVTTPWLGRFSSFPNHVLDGRQVRSPNLGPVFGFFVDRWHDETWAELLRYGVGWYLTANTHPGVETQLVLAQAGLELASWTVSVFDRCSTDYDEQNRASDRIRYLLSRANTPMHIVGSSFNALAVFAEEHNWEDGPHAVTALRNLLVHPTTTLRPLEVASEVMMDAGLLARAYLQAALLFILQYDDEYVPHGGLGRQEGTPWDNPLVVSPTPEHENYSPESASNTREV